MTKYTESDFIQLASGHYLTKVVPDNWEDMDDNAAYEFIESNIWQPIEYWPTNEVIAEINNLAFVMASIANDAIDKYKESQND